MSSDVTSIYSQEKINSPKSSGGSIYEFENFRLDAASLMLYKDSRPVTLAPKVIETLAALVERSGEVVSKEELMNRLWADSFVEESNLTQNIYLLRKTLGKTTDGKDLIETFRRRGYRFTAVIKKVGNDENQENKTETNEIGNLAAQRLQTETAGNGKRYFAIGAIAAVVLLLLAIFAAARLFDYRTGAGQSQFARSDLQITRVTPDLNVRTAAFTPDGKYLVYTLLEKGKQSIWLKDLATGGATPILPPVDEPYDDPKISPDNFLYYSTARKNTNLRTALIRVPLNGGGEQIVAQDLTSPFAFSPDEKQIAFVNSQGQIRIAQADGSGEERVLAQRDGKTRWYESWGSRMSWSPDGSSIAICGGRRDGDGKRISELIEVNMADGSEKIIPTPAWNYLDDAVWLADKSALLVVARETETAPFQIWRVRYPSGETTRITNDTNDYTDLGLSPDSRRLIAMQKLGNYNLWLAPIDDAAKAKQITFGNAAQDGFYGIAFAPGGKIIYTSPRDGNWDLWEIDPANGEQKQLTKNAGDWNGKPRVSPDNRYIVFASTRKGARQIWRIDRDGANPKQLTDKFESDEPSFSPDGKQIYFSARNGGEIFIARVPVEGGATERVSQPPRNFFTPQPSPDGKLIFCQFYDSSFLGPWHNGVIRADTGELIKTFDFHFGGFWAADSKSIIYSLPGGNPNLWQISIKGNTKPQPFTNFENGVSRTFAVSPDWKQIVIARGNPTSEAVLISGF